MRSDRSVGQQHRDPDPSLDGLDLALQLLAQFAVERAQRFIEQQGIGREDQCAGERHALLLPARAGAAGGDVPPVDANPAAAWRLEAAIIIKVVVLPEPLGPSKVRNSPGSRVKLTSRTTKIP